MEYQSQELQDKYQNDPQFRKKADQLEDQYLYLQAKSTQLRKDKLIDESIFERFPVDNAIHLYFWYGYMQPPPGKQTTKLTLNFIKMFQPQLGRKFIFVYFNHRTPSSDYFFEFKHIFQLLPLSILENLKTFILIKPSFYMKALGLLGSSLVSTFSTESYLCFENCRELCTKMKLEVNSFATFVPDPIAQEFPKESIQKPTLASYRLNIQGQTMTEKEKKQKTDFQLSVKAFFSMEVYTLQSFEEGELGIPKILQLLISYFKQKPQGLELQGIFRKSVSIDEENYILEQLGQRNYEYLHTIENPYLIGCLIKRFFYNLKIPLIPFSHYNRLIKDQGLNNIKAVVRDLPKKNYLTLMFLLDFLKKDVITKEPSNKMGTYGIAVCFSQSLMRAEVQSEEALLNSKTVVVITNTLIVEFDMIFDDHENKMKLLSERMNNQKQQFEKTVRLELSLDINNRFSADEYREISDIISPVAGSSEKNKPFSQANIIQEFKLKDEVKEEIPKDSIKDIKKKQQVKQKVLQDLKQELSIKMKQNANSDEKQDVKKEMKIETKKQTPHVTYIQKQLSNSANNSQEKLPRKIYQNTPTGSLNQKITSISEELKQIQDKFKARKSTKLDSSKFPQEKSPIKPILLQKQKTPIKNQPFQPKSEINSPTFLIKRLQSQNKNLSIILPQTLEHQRSSEQQLGQEVLKKLTSDDKQ